MGYSRLAASRCAPCSAGRGGLPLTTTTTNMPIKTLDTILPGFAALDLGATSIHAATANAPVQITGTYLCDLRKLSDWLRTHHVQAVCMEATGVYWYTVFAVLEQAGFEVTLFHGAHARNLPGKKTDFSDCQWHAVLFSHGLLRPCFIPAPEIRTLRVYARQREDHLEQAAMHLQRMQKALDCMGVRVHTVVSQLHGVSGLRIVEAILAGERDPKVLTALCETQILNQKRAEVEASLEGDWREEHLFELEQALQAWRFVHQQIAACDQRTAAQLQKLAAACPPVPRVDPKKVKPIRHNAPQIADLHHYLFQLSGGRDVGVLPAFTALSWLKLTAELGFDLSAWKTAKAFTSWLGLAPNRHQSGRRRRRVRRRHTRAGQIFREAALSITRSKYLALGGCYRRIRGRCGEAVAMVALARKLATLYYLAMTKGLAYVEQGLINYEAHCRAQEQHRLHKFARRMGYTLVKNEPEKDHTQNAN